jgi:hypothetical protein
LWRSSGSRSRGRRSESEALRRSSQLSRLGVDCRCGIPYLRYPLYLPVTYFLSVFWLVAHRSAWGFTFSSSSTCWCVVFMLHRIAWHVRHLSERSIDWANIYVSSDDNIKILLTPKFALLTLRNSFTPNLTLHNFHKFGSCQVTTPPMLVSTVS